MTDWANVCMKHFGEPAEMPDGKHMCPACWWDRYGPRVVVDLPDPIPLPAHGHPVGNYRCPFCGISVTTG